MTETAGARPADLTGRRVLLALSGGLDSTWSLHKLLTETDAAVFAHHVDYDVGDGARNELERVAVGSIVEWLAREARPFTFSTSRHDLRGLGPHLAIRSVSLIAPLVAVAAAAAGFGEGDVVIFGHNASDEENEEAERRAGLPGALSLIQSGVSAVYASIGPAPTVTRIEPFPSREQQVRDLPEPIVAATWSCRVPVPTDGGFRPCRLCRTCLELADVLPRYALGDRYTTMALRLAMSDPHSRLCRALAAL